MKNEENEKHFFEIFSSIFNFFGATRNGGIIVVIGLSCMNFSHRNSTYPAKGGKTVALSNSGRLLLRNRRTNQLEQCQHKSQ